MARNHARILTSIWNDDDFIALSPGAQRMYLLLLSQQNLSHCGLLPLTVKRWANKSKGSSTEQVERWLAELEETRFIVMDDSTEELLIRSLIRGDEVYKQLNVLKAATKDVRAIASSRLRFALALEVDRMIHMEGLPDAARGELERLALDLPNPSRTPPEPQAKGSEVATGRGMVTLVSSGSPAPTTSPAPTPATSATPTRDDVNMLCELLADGIEANGSKRPTITARWRDAARLLLDKDHKPLNEVMGLVAWSQHDEFWRANVMSMTTFREKYDQLRLQRARDPGPKQSRNASILTANMRAAQEHDARAERKALG